MKRAKLIGIGVALVVVAILIYKNLDLFTYAFPVNIPFVWPSESGPSPMIPNVIYLAAFFGLGFLLKFLLGLPGTFAARKTVKALNEEVRTLQSELATVRQQQAGVSDAAAAPGAKTGDIV
ncbi:MAG: lipopolysaccharide assembly protein LapA domain-containing protein [Thermodesulfobacteriota bacterium]